MAALVSLAAPSRPSLYLESAAEFLPTVKRREIEEKGAVVVWAATDTAGRPPPEIPRQFPDLVAEVPRAFTRRFQGRMPLHPLGWGMIRPHTPGVTPEPQPEPPRRCRSRRRRPSRNGRCRNSRKPRRRPSSLPRPLPAPAPAPTTREQPQRQPRTVPQLERHAPQ